jgi:DNA-directed RNA polymerase specialized sigma24 family protein
MMPTMEDRIAQSSVEPRRDHDFDALFRDESAGVYRTLYAYTGGRSDIAEEAVAEAFARALAHASTIREPLPWIYRTAFRLANEELRRGFRRRDAVAFDPDVPGPELDGVMDAIRQLSANQRAAIVLRHLLDLDVGEVAARMGIAAPTVRVHLHRGRQRLRRLLGDEEVN